jgi:predicted nuclease with TOPRIM domain
MSSEISDLVRRVTHKTQRLVEVNDELRQKISELEEQVDHLQETLTALQAEHSDFENQLQQRNLALTVQSGLPARDSYSEEKIAELVREIDRCMKLLSA